MKNLFITSIVMLCLTNISSFAQVGIATTSPQATLDVAASNQIAPTNTDGILIPRIDAFPVMNPTVTQDAMLVYLTTTDGTDASGFYYWNDATTTWLGIGGIGGADTQDLSIDNTVGDLSLVDGGTIELKAIADSDDDTLIQVEEGVDDDTIRYDLEGVEYFRMTTQGQLEFINSGNAIFIGEGAGANDDLTNNKGVFIGYLAGTANTSGANNTFLGYTAGEKVSTGGFNTAVGAFSVDELTIGQFNTGVGNGSLGRLTTGSDNTSIGAGSMNLATTANQNTVIGTNGLQRNDTGNDNVAIGDTAGALSLGSNNVFIGQNADRFNDGAVGNNIIIGQGAGDNSGSNHALSGRIMIGTGAGATMTANNDILVIENSTSTTPLIGGNFATDQVGININPTTSLTSALTVGGDIEATGSLISGTTTYPDYVFENYFTGSSVIKTDYNFTPLNEAIAFVKNNGHLPNVKSYKEIEEVGMVLDVTQTSVKNLEKIEENFLYIAELNQKLEEIQQQNELLTNENKALTKQLQVILKRLEALENNNK